MPSVCPAGVAASLQRLFFGVSAVDDACTLEEAGVEEVCRFLYNTVTTAVMHESCCHLRSIPFLL